MSEDKTYVAFDKFMNYALELGGDLHGRNMLTKPEQNFLDALDHYIDLAVEENELED